MSSINTCIICGTESVPYFQKTFGKYGLAEVDYVRCPGCGFVYSKTHSAMSDEEWSTLNRDYHAGYQSNPENPDDPRWLARIDAQAAVINDCTELGLIPRERPWLDYAAGGGQLSESLRSLGGPTLLNYDRYMTTPEPKLKGAPEPGQFDFVITTSVFEHLRTRADLNAINALVSPSGVMGVHTLVSATVPADPAWFYLLPVHCAFFSNASMAILFGEWGYQSSLYEVNSRLWLFFRRPHREIRAILDQADLRTGKPAYFSKDGFMDYWK